MLRIKYELISRGISQTEFAKSAGLKPQAVSRIVNGLEPPYTKRGKRIAAALGWEGDPSELFEEVTMYAKPTTLGQLQAENAKLRELAAGIGHLLFALDVDYCAGCPRDDINHPCPVYTVKGGECLYETDLRDLGVEVDG